MNFRIVLAATAALALASCGKSETTDAAATASAEASAPVAAETSAAAVPTAAAPAAAAGAAVPSKDYIVGKWAEEGGDCKHLVIEFKADGSMDGPFEKWELDNGVLTMVGNPSKMHLTVIDPDTMESKLDGTGAPKKINRCK